MVIYLLKNKYEVADIIKEYIKFAEAHWNLKLAKLRCDNGREYVNENLRNWCKGNGTEMDLTILYSPQLIGKAKRLNRTLLEKIRVLLEESDMKKEIWGEAAYTATYLLNRSPTKLLDVTPFEMWSGKEPNLNTLKIFGCAAYAKILEPLKKLDDRSRKLIFVGYSPEGYRLWDAENRKIILSRDVKFEEKIEAKIEKNKIGVLGKMEDNEEVRKNRQKKKRLKSLKRNRW
ncbi:Copia protein [Trachymyrmex zeteki]|uniref:Copia protein n=1 Tax=Mycetomoellerius zeteki TaxID=64791 RepID=A0A151WSH4_9HYME|nr:Copia protein [Trachymyrmex zeteki]